MKLRGTKRVPLQLKIIKEDFLNILRRHAWQYKIHRISDSRFSLIFRASYSLNFPFSMKFVTKGEIILTQNISPAGSSWTEIRYFDNFIKAVFRVFLQPLIIIALGMMLLGFLLAFVLKPLYFGPTSILIGLIALFGFLMFIIGILELFLIERNYEKTQSELWKILATHTDDVVSVEEDIAEKKLNLWIISAIFTPGSFICAAILLLAIGMTIKQTVVIALAVFTLPLSFLLGLCWISLSFPLRYRMITEIASQCYFYTLVIISPAALVFCANHPSPNALISALVPGAAQGLESTASLLVVLIIFLAPFVLFMPNIADLSRYIKEGKKPKEITSGFRKTEDISLTSKKVYIFRIFSFVLASFSLIITYLGLGYIGMNIAHPEVLWSSIIKIISYALPGFMVMATKKEIALIAFIIVIWSLIPLALFLAAWIYEILMLLRWKVFSPLKKDSGHEFLDVLTHKGMFDKVKSSLKARHLAIYKDPNPNGICYFAQATRWSGIRGCYGILLDLSALAALTRNNKEIEAVVWHEVGHMVRNKHKNRMLAAVIFFIWHSRIPSLLRDSMALEFKSDEFARARMRTGDFLCAVLLRACEHIRYKIHPTERKKSFWRDLGLILFSYDELSYVYPHYDMRYLNLKRMDH